MRRVTSAVRAPFPYVPGKPGKRSECIIKPRARATTKVDARQFAPGWFSRFRSGIGCRQSNKKFTIAAPEGNVAGPTPDSENRGVAGRRRGRRADSAAGGGGFARPVRYVARRRARGRRHFLHRQPRRGGRHRRRVRLRQVGVVARDHGPAGETRRPGDQGARAVRRSRPAQAVRRRDARDPRPRHLDDLPGADDLAQPGPLDRRADHGAAVHPSEDDGRAGAGARARTASARRHHRRRAAPATISAPAFGRHAPARDDRDRAGLQSQAHHRRRADHGARRHHPGADPRADEGSVAAAQHRADHHHPQSRRGRPLRRPRQRDVRGAHHRARHRRRRLPAAAASLHDRPDALGAAARPAARRQARDHRGLAARSAHAAAGLPLCAALPLSPRRLRCDRRDPARSRAGPRHGLHPRRRDRRRHAGASCAAGQVRRDCDHDGIRRPDPEGRGAAQVFLGPAQRHRRDLLQDRDGEGGRRRIVYDRAGRDARARGRIRLRQDHRRSHRAQARRADRRHDPLRRRRYHAPNAARDARRCAAASR